MKRFLFLMLGLVIAISCIPAFPAIAAKYFYDGQWHEYKIAPISLQICGENLQTDMPPIIFQDSSVVPARAVFEKLGAKVDWDSAKYQVIVSLENTKVVLSINNKKAMVNDKTYEMLIPPKIVNDRTMIPVRFVAEALGMLVEWKDAERVIKIDRPDVKVNNIQYSLNGSNLRITISSDIAIRDYATSEYNDHPRVAVDIKNSLLTASVKEMDVKSNYVYKIRSAQNSTNPNITRVVADMSQWTAYTVTLSEDKKQLYIDFNNDPTDITAAKFSTSGEVDCIDIETKYARTSVIASSGSSDKIVVDMPMTKVGSIQKNIQANGYLVKSCEFTQLDPLTARITINVKGNGFIELKNMEKGVRLEVSSPLAKGIVYSNKGTPEFTINNERIGINYFNYKFWNEGNKYTVTVPSRLLGVGAGRLYTNDTYFDYIDIIKTGSGQLTDLVFNAKKPVVFSTNTVQNNEKMIIGAKEGSLPGTVLDPKAKEKIVVIDPGHGGDDTGALYPNNLVDKSKAQVYEKDLNLDISIKLRDMLTKAGVKVHMTRDTDKSMTLYERADFANNMKASLFLSVHNNGGYSHEYGTMTLFYPTVYESVYGISSERVAQITQEEMLKSLGTKNLGVYKRPRLAVLNGTTMPGALAEVAYVTNEGDRQMLMTDEFRTKAAQSLCNAVIRALNEIVIASSSSTAIQTGNQQPPTPTPSIKPEDLQPRNINGFAAPPKASAKCEYRGNSDSQPSIFDLTIQLDYGKEVGKKATLEDQRKEARQVLLTKLDEETVNRIMEAAEYQKDYASYIWEDDIVGGGYTIWVRCLRNSGIATIDLIRRQ